MKLPGVLRKREVLATAKADPAEMSALGRAFLAEERFVDAVDFLAKAGDVPGLTEVLAAAVEQGDYFLATLVERRLDSPVGPEVWGRLAEKAAALGKDRFAASARSRLEVA